MSWVFFKVLCCAVKNVWISNQAEFFRAINIIFKVEFTGLFFCLARWILTSKLMTSELFFFSFRVRLCHRVSFVLELFFEQDEEIIYYYYYYFASGFLKGKKKTNQPTPKYLILSFFLIIIIIIIYGAWCFCIIDLTSTVPKDCFAFNLLRSSFVLCGLHCCTYLKINPCCFVLRRSVCTSVLYATISLHLSFVRRSLFLKPSRFPAAQRLIRVYFLDEGLIQTWGWCWAAALSHISALGLQRGEGSKRRGGGVGSAAAFPLALSLQALLRCGVLTEVFPRESKTPF